MKNIYLVGMMGSGKTTTGRALAKLLSIPFVDLDDEIEDDAGRSINEIFKREGEAYFRTIESKLLAQVSHGSNQVIGTGGGIVLNPSNSERMKSTGSVIYLKTSLEILWERVKEKTDRPLLATSNPRQTLTELFKIRAPLYEAACETMFITDRKSPEAVAREIYTACFGKT